MLVSRGSRIGLLVIFLAMSLPSVGYFEWPIEAQTAEIGRAANSRKASANQAYPELVDIVASTGIRFEHLSSPEQRYIVESMSGGVALIDYDRDGWPDIYFTNAQSVAMALHGQKARSALYHNNHDGTFTDVSDKAGVAYPCWAQGAVVGTTTTTAGQTCW